MLMCVSSGSQAQALRQGSAKEVIRARRAGSRPPGWEVKERASLVGKVVMSWKDQVEGVQEE
jgi:hypothetical protein